MSIVKAALAATHAVLVLEESSALRRVARAELAGESPRDADRRILEAFVERDEEMRIAEEQRDMDDDEHVLSYMWRVG